MKSKLYTKCSECGVPFDKPKKSHKCIPCNREYTKQYALRPRSDITDKMCSKCNRMLPVAKFYKDKTSKTGYSYYCKDCIKLHHKLIGESKGAQRHTKREIGLIRFYQLLSKNSHVCPLCKVEMTDLFNESPFTHFDTDVTVDHRIPVSMGGDNSDQNLWLLCMHCNSVKSDNIILEALDGILD